MGMPIVLDIPDANSYSSFKKVFMNFRETDERFSPYKTNSELNRYNRGEISHVKLNPQMLQVINYCRKAETATGGYFSAWDGKVFDPSGYVKAWSIEQAVNLLKELGVESFCLSAGGDILARGNKIWRIGIQNPHDNNQIVATIKLKNMSIATSGNYERGLHIRNPKTGKPADFWASLSVVGQEIVTADVLATAGFASGPKALELIKKHSGYQALAIRKNGQTQMTSGISKLLV